MWDGNAIRRSWRIVPSQAGRYRVVTTRAGPPGSESSATIHFRAVSHQGSGTAAVRSIIPPTESWNTYPPFVLGEIDLKAEEYLVEYFARDWSHPKYLINLKASACFLNPAIAPKKV